MDERKQIPNTFYDDIKKIPQNILFHTREVSRQVVLKNWDFEKESKKQLSSFIKEYGNIKVFPKGWADAEKKLNIKEQLNIFEGHDTQSAGAFGFDKRINLSNTYYSATEQNILPILTIYSSAFAHGLGLMQHNNQIELLNILKDLKSHYNIEDFPNATYIEDLSKISNNKLFNALMVDYYPNTEKTKYSSQSELDKYLENIEISNEKYGMVSFFVSNSKNTTYSRHKVYKIHSFEHFKESIVKNIEKHFKKSEAMELYLEHELSYFTKEEILSSLKFKEISREEFNTLNKIFDNNLEFGKVHDFIKYKMPTTDELIKMNSANLKQRLLDAVIDTHPSLKEGDSSCEMRVPTHKNIVGRIDISIM